MGAVDIFLHGMSLISRRNDITINESISPNSDCLSDKSD